jgi:N6-adenosine-specific RNA methylase IME4
VIKTILIDPPYKMCSGGLSSLNPKDHYQVQTKDEIIATLEKWFSENLIAPEAHMYCWGINSYSAGYSKGLFDTLDIIQHFGFRPITNIVWLKNGSNPTPYGQRATELCVFATKHRKGQHKSVMYCGSDSDSNVVGSGLSKSVDWIKAPRTKHSKKPDTFYEYIEERSQPPYLECYARNNREGWLSLGNELT